MNRTLQQCCSGKKKKGRGNSIKGVSRRHVCCLFQKRDVRYSSSTKYWTNMISSLHHAGLGLLVMITHPGRSLPCLTITSSYLGLLVVITHPGRSLHALPILYPLIFLWTSCFKTSVQMVEEVKIKIPHWLYFEIRNQVFCVMMSSGTKNIIRCLRLCVAHHSLFAVEHETCLLTSPEKKCERGLW